MVKTVIVVVAVPGAGKTTILKKLKEIMPSVSVVNFGDIMLGEATKHFGVTDRDEMRKRLALTDYRKLQLHAAETIAGLGDDVVVIDTHAAISTPYGYYPGLPSEIIRTLNVDLIVFLEFRPEDILARRETDQKTARNRGVDGVEAIEEHQNVSKMFAVAAANEAKCYLKILRYYYPQQYPFQHAIECAEELANLIKLILQQKGITT
ncbi:MAG: adenylate kinase [Nitrososphaerota archaeon]|nr:adenylate kinase [Aigarchaeota archaeon]MDW8077182.1 adenylate kinase [Nitrososphaerota archaeon]